MINNNFSTSSVKQMRQGTDTEFVTRHKPDAVFDRQVRIRFLQQSASYLGKNLAQHELAARYMHE